MTPTARLHIAGSADPNPGAAGFAYHLELPDGGITERNYPRHRSTNNRMELCAAIAGLMETPDHLPVELRSASEYLTQGMQHGPPDTNTDLWDRLQPLLKARQVLPVWTRSRSTPIMAQLSRDAIQASRKRRRRPDQGFEQNPGRVA